MNKTTKVIVMLTIIILLSLSVFADKYAELRARLYKLVDKKAESLIGEDKIVEAKELLVNIHGKEEGAKKYDEIIVKINLEQTIKSNIENAERFINDARGKINNAERSDFRGNKADVGSNAIIPLNSANKILVKIDSTKLTQDQSSKVKDLKISIEELTKRAKNLGGKDQKPEEDKDKKPKVPTKKVDNKFIWIIIIVVFVIGGGLVGIVLWTKKIKKLAEESSDSKVGELEEEAKKEESASRVDDPLSGFGDEELDVEGISSALNFYSTDIDNPITSEYGGIREILVKNKLDNIYENCKTNANSITYFISSAKGTEISEAKRSYYEGAKQCIDSLKTDNNMLINKLQKISKIRRHKDTKDTIVDFISKIETINSYLDKIETAVKKKIS